MPSAITPDFVDTLLALPTTEQQISTLAAAQLLTTEGLTGLLEVADTWLETDPDKAFALAGVCQSAASQAGVTTVQPRAAYLRGQLHAMRGEFDLALAMIEAARTGYDQLGMALESLRTHVGLMRVLGETGRYGEALDLGQRVLDSIADTQTPEYVLLMAHVQRNRGVCHERIGRFADALIAFAAAEQLYATLGLDEPLADLRINRGLVLVQMGRVQEALALYEAALRIYQQRNLPVAEAQTLLNIGEGRLLLGDYMLSLQSFEQATQLLDTLGQLADAPILLRQLADAYLMLNLASDALDAYRRADQQLATMNLLHDRGLCLWGMGMSLAALQRLDEAQQTLAAAAALFRSIDNIPLLVGVMLEQAALLNEIGDASQARQLVFQANLLVNTGDWPVQRAYACLRQADFLLPDVAAVAPLLLEVQAIIAPLNLPHLRYGLYQRLGHLRLLQGDDGAAEGYFLMAIEQIEQLRSTLAHERLRVSFLADKLTAYQALMQLYLNRGDEASVRAAFAISEQAKSRALADLLAGIVGAQLESSPNPFLAAQLDALQANLNAVYNELLGREFEETSGASDEPPSADVRSLRMATLQSRATELEQAIAQLRLRQMAVSPLSFAEDSDASISVDHAPAPDLISDLTLLVYHLVGAEVMVFVNHAGRVYALRALCTADEIQRFLDQLAAQWSHLRGGQRFVERHLHQLERSAQRALQALYARLMAPVLELLDSLMPMPANAPRKLVVVPHRQLYGVPFHALYDGQRYLVDFCELSYASSATVFQLCQQRHIPAAGAAWVLGVADARIPSVTDETSQVSAHLRQHFCQVHTWLNDAAVRKNLPAATANCAVLHLACHGLFRDDNPLFSALKLHDGWLTAADVMQMTFNGTLVTLSACESGRSQALVVDEIVGLSYAFFSAGAASLLVSQWLVHDQAATLLMDVCYRQLNAGADLAAALRLAQLAVKAQYAHPYFWAPFVLLGGRDGYKF